MDQNSEGDKLDSTNKKSIQEKSARQLLKRILPNHYSQFSIRIIDGSDGCDYFEITSSRKRINITGSTGVAVSAGFNWYLKNYCNAHFSWEGDQLNLPTILPEVKEKITIKSPFKYRYYFNYCTFSYSMPWWDWNRWEREIDLMALNGINFPLAIVGHEAVWENVFQDFGMTEKDILEAFAGPAFRAWGWMGNIECWGGPLPKSWIKNQAALQKKILKRQRSLGMIPILQGFSGIVPEKFKKYFPHANIHQLPGWYGFKGVYQLDPNDPLFSITCKKFMEEQNKLYGTNHFYSADIYHELNYSSNDVTYLLDLTKGVYTDLIKNDPEGVWVMQSWSLKEEILKVLPDEKIIILDLFCDSEPKWGKNNAFNSKPWIWCALHNFGGRTGLSGRLDLLTKEIPAIINNDAKGNLTGIGYAPEGIENNYVFYNLLAELAWKTEKINLDEWIINYIHTRYGKEDINAEKAWIILLKTVYSGPKSYGPLESEICAKPSLNIKKVSSNGELRFYYEPEKLIEALELLLSCNKEFINSQTYRHDLIDVFRQVLVNIGKPLYQKIVDLYNSQEIDTFVKETGDFLQLIEDIDLLLSANDSFLLGKWIEEAKKLGRTPKEKALLEWNARRQITLWSTPEINEFHDYANKQWAGLMKDYYFVRWKMFFDFLLKSLQNNDKFDESDFQKKIDEFSVKWSFSKKEFSSKAIGDSIEVAQQLFNKYKPIFDEVYQK